ncbi:peptidase inhibitor family I36 protein [Nonomuraea sp. NPDC049158]|uniref:peptidase inhibitor family I36 protein n=1 Tax=Nonomuraea sp. NPDC049158 TaxID=3155649 RepID=UPI0033E60E57
MRETPHHEIIPATHRTTRHPHVARTAVTLAVAGVAALLIPWSAPSTAHAATTTAAALPPGVIQLADGEPCPPATLCLYQHYGRRGPAYGVGAGYPVDLHWLPMGDQSAANNVSSWVNNTESDAVLIDLDNDNRRVLQAGRPLEEPSATNDTVDLIEWDT